VPVCLCAYVKRVNVQVFWYMWISAGVHTCGEVNVCTRGETVGVHYRYTQNVSHGWDTVCWSEGGGFQGILGGRRGSD
jgi:hypothetical protein